MIIQTVTKNDLYDAFSNMNRSDNFSHAALDALYDYLDEMSDDNGAPYALDVIALCCEYSEYSDLEELQGDYSSVETMDDLEAQTFVIMIDENSFIIQQF